MLCEITENTIIQYFLCVQKLLWDGKTEFFIEMLDFLEKSIFLSVLSTCMTAFTMPLFSIVTTSWKKKVIMRNI